MLSLFISRQKISCFWAGLFSYLCLAAAAFGQDVTANAGLDRAVVPGEAVTLDASGSLSPTGERLSYSWSLLTAPAESTLTLEDETSPYLTVTPDVEGDYVFQINVAGLFGYEASDQVVVSTGNIAPLANAGEDQRLSIGDIAVFDPEGTLDVNGDMLEANWTIVNAPVDSTAEIIEDDGGRQTLRPDIAGIYEIELTVTDSDGLS